MKNAKNIFSFNPLEKTRPDTQSEKSHNCEECNEIFLRENNLNKYVLIHTHEKQ